MRGNSVLRHAAIASSLRSTARRAGRCRLQPNRSRKIVQVCVSEYRTPVTPMITSATRAKVHMSVGNPFALGPFINAADRFRFQPRSRPPDDGTRSDTPRLSCTTAQSERTTH